MQTLSVPRRARALLAWCFLAVALSGARVHGGEALWKAVSGYVDSQDASTRLLNGDALRAGPDFLVVTYVSAGHSRAYRLFASAEEYTIPLLVRGSAEDTWNQLLAKFIFMRKFIRLLPEDVVVMFVDAFDVVFAGTAPSMVAAFDAFAAPLVLSAEVTPYPDPTDTLQAAYEAAFGANATWRGRASKYANSGTYVGRAAAVADFMDWSLESELIRTTQCRADYVTGESRIEQYPRQHDQACTHLFVLHSGRRVALDTEQRIFATLQGRTCAEYRWEWHVASKSWGARYLEDSRESRPLLLHGNGGSKWLLHAVMEERARLADVQLHGIFDEGVMEDGGARVVYQAC